MVAKVLTEPVLLDIVGRPRRNVTSRWRLFRRRDCSEEGKGRQQLGELFSCTQCVQLSQEFASSPFSEASSRPSCGMQTLPRCPLDAACSAHRIARGCTQSLLLLYAISAGDS